MKCHEDITSRHFIYFLRNTECLFGISGHFYILSSHQKPDLHHTRGITPKRVTSGGAHLRGLAPGQHSCAETLQLASRW